MLKDFISGGFSVTATTAAQNLRRVFNRRFQAEDCCRERWGFELTEIEYEPEIHVRTGGSAEAVALWHSYRSFCATFQGIDEAETAYDAAQRLKEMPDLMDMALDLHRKCRTVALTYRKDGQPRAPHKNGRKHRDASLKEEGIIRKRFTAAPLMHVSKRLWHGTRDTNACNRINGRTSPWPPIYDWDGPQMG